MTEYAPDMLPQKKPFSLQLDPKSFEPATAEEKAQHDVMRESTTFFKDGIKRLSKNPLSMMSLAILVLLLITILVAPMIVPYKYSEVIRVDGQRDRSTTNLYPFTYSVMEQQKIDAGE